MSGEEYIHAVKVMRLRTGDTIHLTDGIGNMYEGEVREIRKEELIANILNRKQFDAPFKNFTIYIPRLKKEERLEFAVEKAIELGFADLVIYYSGRTIMKKARTERWNKIALSAMKQSLNFYLPAIKIANKLTISEGTKILFDQSGDSGIREFKFKRDEKYSLIFGPEGSLTEEEISHIGPDHILKLFPNRLRSETAIISALSFIGLDK
jgi:16S rRNA (uracil1498-N3)-methyltransferase